MKLWKYNVASIISNVGLGTSIAGGLDKLLGTEFINLNGYQLGALAVGGFIMGAATIIIKDKKLKKIASELGYKGILTSSDLTKKQKELIESHKIYELAKRIETARSGMKNGFEK